MKYRGPIFLSLTALLFLVAAYFPRTDDSVKEAVLMQAIMGYLGQVHYQPKPINDEFSEELYDLYLDRLDGSRRFLTQEDVSQLEPYRESLDDEAMTGTFNFFDRSLELINASVAKTQHFYREILAKPFDFEKKEKVELDGEKRGFAKNDKELYDFWRRYLKYETMTRLTNKLEEQEKAGEESERKSEAELEMEAREEVLEMFDKWFERLQKLKRVDRLSYYLNTITNLFDPHSDYLKPIDKENFNIRFSGRFEGIGARLQEDGDFTKVVEIIVGGPAWQGKELEENDLITKVAQGDEEPVNVTGLSLDDVVSMIRGEKGTEVRLTVKKVDGSIEEISIIRDIVIIEEGFAKSLILDGVQEGERIGYIYLPRFYADFENSDGRFCSQDVAKEIEKLKAEEVDGIVLDLRNNGGGALYEVVKMSGLFIEKGPIVQVKSRGRQPEVLSDTDPMVQYTGPLVVMVNSFSASASEILAAALQDYERAVIVGSNSTFGKGTVQRFYPLDRIIRGHEDVKPLGEIKLTMQKFYRIDGGSTQLRGVTPDIVLPDNYTYITTGEKDLEYAMDWSQIDPVPHDQNVMKVSNLDDIARRSRERVANNETFSRVLANAERLKEQRDQSAFPLNIDGYRDLRQQREKESEAFSDLFKDVVNDGVFNLEVDLPNIHADESKEARNQDWIKSVSKDVYLQEVLHIMHDMIELE